MRGLQVLAPTLFEYAAARCLLAGTRVAWAGLRLSRWSETQQRPPVVICGLAGALTRDLPPGTVLIPDRVGLPDGRLLCCEPSLVEPLQTAARALGFTPERRPLLTAPALVTGFARQTWAQRGFVAVDMETALLATKCYPVATVRVILDTPERDLAPDWQRPASTLLQPDLWREWLWLARVAPHFALRAARVVKVGLRALPEDFRAASEE
jgi:hypothetical protein